MSTHVLGLFKQSALSHKLCKVAALHRLWSSVLVAEHPGALRGHIQLEAYDTHNKVVGSHPLWAYYLTADKVSLSVISDGTHAEDVRTANMAASAMSEGCKQRSGTNIPSVMGVLTAAG